MNHNNEFVFFREKLETSTPERLLIEFYDETTATKK